MPKDESMKHPLPGCVTLMKWSRAPIKTVLLMEQLPHLLVEGMPDLRVRAESVSWLHLPAWRIYRSGCTSAPCDCGSHRSRFAWQKYHGHRVLTSELFVHTGAGRYICGEETALINSLEGRRANPALQAALPGDLRRMGASRPV
nr:NADH dehydrogenase I chain F [Salmonella sp. NCTC 7297]